jgi:fructokinase
MSRVYSIGETLLDIIFHAGGHITATPGGAMLNTAVSLGRLKLPVHLISEYGDDTTGRWIDDFLKDNGVDLTYIHRYTGMSPIALAFLDEKKTAAFQFYPGTPHTISSPVTPLIAGDDIVLFGSFYSLNEENRPRLLSLLSTAVEKRAIIIYDPNFREPHLRGLPRLMPAIVENIGLSRIVRGSDDDFKMIFGETEPAGVYRRVTGHGCDVLIYTMGSRGVMLMTEVLTKVYDVPAVTPVSTVGAGDSFNAGLISALVSYGSDAFQPETLNEAQWDVIMTTAIDFATAVCSSNENYIPVDFAQNRIRKNRY